MAYHHILVHREETSTRFTLLFKDLSEEELYTPFLVRFIRAARRGSAEEISVNSLRASVIRTEHPHDKAVSDYLIAWGEQAEEFMRVSGYPVNSQPLGDAAILGAGEDVTAEFMAASHDRGRKGGGERKKIGRYKITGKLGAGKFGMVYAGLDPASQRRVAIKTVLKSANGDPFASLYPGCLLREVLVGKRVSHPGIVHALEIGDDGDIEFAAVEFIEAFKIRGFFDRGNCLEIGDVVIFMGDLCSALEAAHEAGIVHRNLTPGNVLMTAEGSAKVTDFDFALLSGPDASLNLSQGDGTLIGTPECASPEAIAGAAIDRRSDVFSVGIILFQLLTGENPFAGPDMRSIAKRILQEDPPPASSLNAAVSSHFDAVVAKALAKDPARRYQTALELDGALQAAMWKSGPGRLVQSAAPIESIGQYRIVRELEADDFPIYEALDTVLNRPVHITSAFQAKNSPEDYASILNGFRRHAHVAARFEHPGIVPAYEAGETDGIAYLATAPLIADTLKARMQDSIAWPYPQAVDLVSRLLEVLQFLHRNGIVHRDVKPAGIVQEIDGCVRLTDCSAALFIDPSEPIEHEEEGLMVGTPAYMSPEQIAGERLDGRSDLFAAATILYTLLTGKRPFGGTSGTEIMKGILNDTPALPSRLNSSLPRACDAVVMRALAKDPKARFPSAADFGVALRSAVVAEPEMNAFIVDKIGTFWCSACISIKLPEANRDLMESWRRQGSTAPEHCARCGNFLDYYPRP